MRCTKCGCENPDYAVACERCGAFLPMEEPDSVKKDSILDPIKEKLILCAYCWGQNRASDELCRYCGMPLSYVPYPEREGEGEEYVEREEQEEREKERAIEDPFAEEKTSADEAIEEMLNEPETNIVPEGMIRCRYCWRDNPDTATYCEYCDKKLHRSKKNPGDKEDRPSVFFETIECPVCGKKNDAAERKCFYCGVDLYGGVMPEDNEFTGLFSGTVAAIALSRALDIREEERKRKEEQEKIERSKHRGSVNYAVPGKKRCRSCWYDNPASAERCVQCGAPLGKVHTVKGKGKNNTGK